MTEILDEREMIELLQARWSDGYDWLYFIFYTVDLVLSVLNWRLISSMFL